jgi:hypothetical protein
MDSSSAATYWLRKIGDAASRFGIHSQNTFRYILHTLQSFEMLYME